MDFISLNGSDVPGENNKLTTGQKAENERKLKRHSIEVAEINGCRVGHSKISCQEWTAGAKEARIIRLHHEIKHFYESMTATPDEQSARQDVVDRISSVVHGLWSGAKVEIFGSFKTGLFLPTSDLDLVIFGRWKTKPLHMLSDELVKHGVCSRESTKVIDKATVPIIKLVDSRTEIKVDISFNMCNGESSAEMIQQYMKQYPSLPYLVLVLKQFLHQRDLNDVYTGGIGSYCLVLLIVSFLQLHCRADVQTGAQKTGGKLEHLNLGVLLMEFFELYGINFNYGWAGISVRNKGRYVKKTDGETTLYVEDPQCPESDVARGSFNITQIQIAMSHAYHALSNAVLDLSDERHGDGSGASQSTHGLLCDDGVLSCIVQMPHQKHQYSTPPRSKFARTASDEGSNSWTSGRSSSKFDRSRSWTDAKRIIDRSTKDDDRRSTKDDHRSTKDDRQRTFKKATRRRMIRSMIDAHV